MNLMTNQTVIEAGCLHLNSGRCSLPVLNKTRQEIQSHVSRAELKKKKLSLFDNFVCAWGNPQLQVLESKHWRLCIWFYFQGGTEYCEGGKGWLGNQAIRRSDLISASHQQMQSPKLFTLCALGFGWSRSFSRIKQVWSYNLFERHTTSSLPWYLFLSMPLSLPVPLLSSCNVSTAPRTTGGPDSYVACYNS